MDSRTWRIRALVAALLPIAGCDPSKTDAAYWQRVNAPVDADDAGASGDDAPSGGGGAPSDPSDPGTSNDPGDGTSDPTTGDPTTGAIQISATTVSYRGEYAPENVGAIWIADESGALVRTLETWGSKRFKNAVAYRAVARADEIDVVSGATRKSSGTHTVTWDGRDYRGAAVDGTSFLLNIEFTEDDSASKKPAGPHRVVPFSTAPDASEPTAPDDAFFRGITITRSP